MKLNREQIATLFNRDIKTIGKHINNALIEELDNSTVAKFATIQLPAMLDGSKDYMLKLIKKDWNI